MRKKLLFVLVGALTAVPTLDAGAKPRRVERKVSFAYQGFCVVAVNGTTRPYKPCVGPSTLIEVVRKGESYVKVSAVDVTGRPVGLLVVDPSVSQAKETRYCGGMPKSVRTAPGRGLRVRTLGDATCGGLPTSGTITVVFSNLP